MLVKSLQSKPPDKHEGSGDAGSFSDLVPTRNCQPAFHSQAPALPPMRFPILSTICPLSLRTAQPGQLPPTCGGPSSGRWARACCPLQMHPRAGLQHGR